MTSTESLRGEHVICQLCSKPFTDPRILPCLHSFCLQCLHHVIEKVGTQQSIQCPICLRSLPIPVGGASILPQNLHLGFDAEVFGYMSKFFSDSEVSCTFCVNGCTDSAVVFCCTCHQFMCSFGKLSHQRVPQLSHHTVIELDKASASQLLTTMKPAERCCSQPKHRNSELNLYCNTCDSFICQDCTMVLHKEHNITELFAAAEGHRSEIKAALQSALEVVPTLVGAIRANESTMQVEDASIKAIGLAIPLTFRQLIEALEERMKVLLLELKSISLTRRTFLGNRKEQLEKMQKEIVYCTEVASQVLQTHADHEVVALGKLILTELNATMKKVESASLTPDQHSHLTLSLQIEPLVKEISKLGSFVHITPSAIDSTCTHLSRACRVKGRYQVEVETKTAKGERYSGGGLQVMAELRRKSNNGPVISGVVNDHGDGTYTITLTPQSAGPHQLHVTIEGQHLHGSPYELDVKDGYTTLFNPEQVINVGGNPVCVAVHMDGDLYVGCSDDHIYIFDQIGHLKNTIGGKGDGHGQFDGPGIAIKENVMYVADFNNHRVQKLTREGEFLCTFGEKGSGNGQFEGPYSIVIDINDRVIVSDSGNNRVQVFDKDGGWLLTIDGNGSGDHTFEAPGGLALDPDGNVHITAFASDAIKVFTLEGAYVRTYGGVKGPIDASVDEYGYCFVIGENLAVFDPDGNKIHTVGNLNEPNGIAIDMKRGYFYVANHGDSNVLKYTM